MGWIVVKPKLVFANLLAGVGMLVSSLLTSELPFVILRNNKKKSGLKEPVQKGNALNHGEITWRSSEIHMEKTFKTVGAGGRRKG